MRSALIVFSPLLVALLIILARKYRRRHTWRYGYVPGQRLMPSVTIRQCTTCGRHEFDAGPFGNHRWVHLPAGDPALAALSDAVRWLDDKER